MKGIRGGKLWQNKKKNIIKIGQNKNLRPPQKKIKTNLFPGRGCWPEAVGTGELPVTCPQQKLTVVTAAEHKAAEILLHPCSQEALHSQTSPLEVWLCSKYQYKSKNRR